ncbi:Dehydrogenase (flavoprotein) [Fodinibius roseus]|uniref:Dehydrogenase (Flavoprotein) n=1 Tax=Fodinibius roseus TaxID=1194090 RepID=A0A1M5JAQ6_9BACT|nr:NAD(P)/FAD-dependent oxidoreductase [Fodinibius roseus]SHG37654.1 Dehydrogenase (flavoprotein) [Fodinibius roseus]
MKKEHVHVIGAGPAGLVAAINLAKNGYPVTVYEMKEDVGTRFNGDYQGIENWSTEEDARQFLQTVGVETNFRFEPYADGDFFNPSGEKYYFNMSRPLFYLVERGTSEWSLDQGLKRQALQTGVQFEWGRRMTHAPGGKVIISTGPKAADVVARGMVFKTMHENYYAAFLDDEIAPQGYAYLLVNDGKATFATCLFEKFSESFTYFDAAFERMQEHVNIDIIDSKSFGGYINFSLNQPLMKDHRIYYVGENAGFQDLLFGFGIRFAMHSGYLAAQSIMEDLSYPALCREHIIPKMETSLANRWLFTRLENLGYTIMLDRLADKEDIIPTLQTQYNPSWYKKTVLPVAKRAFKTRLEDKQCMHENCSCVWCRHGEHAYAEVEC